MNFAHPGILIAGLLAVSIPILIHLLLRRKRQPVPWAAMRFLLEAYRKRRRKLTLEQMLLLAIRCLLLALLGVAIAAPEMGGSGAGSSGRLLVLLVDDSIASGATVGGSTDLQRSTTLALRAMDQVSPAQGDRIAVVALGGPARALVSPPSADVAATRRVLENLTPTDSGPDWLGALSVVSSLMELDDESSPATLVLVGGWREGSIDPEQDLAGLLPENVSIVMTPPSPDAAPNISITALTPDRRVVLGHRDTVGGLGRVLVELNRNGVEPLGEQTTTVRVHEALTGASLGSVSVRWTPGERDRSVPVSLDVSGLDASAGRVLLKASVDRDGLLADDTRLTAIESRQQLRVGLIGRPGIEQGSISSFTPTDWARLALGPADSGFITQMIDPESATRARLGELDAAMVLEPAELSEAGWDSIGWFARGGGLVLLAPGPRDETLSWADRFATIAPFWTLPREPELASANQSVGLRRAATRDPLLEVVSGELGFLLAPVGLSKWASPRSSEPGDPVGRILLETQSGSPWLIARSLGEGTIIWMGSPMDLGWTDLPARPLLVPLLQELLRQGVGPTSRMIELVAGDETPPIGARLHRWDPETQAESFSAADQTNRVMQHRGAWLMLDEQDRALGSLITHAQTESSDTTPSDPAAVLAWLEQTGSEIATLDSTATDGGAPGIMNAGMPPRSVAWLVLAMVLMLGLTETWLARRVSHVEGAS